MVSIFMLLLQNQNLNIPVHPGLGNHFHSERARVVGPGLLDVDGVDIHASSSEPE